MIYLTDGNIPLNAAYDDDIVQEANSTYQLTFKFPTNNILWQRLREETFLTADDLHGEQDFVIFEVEKKHGYIQVYANQVMTMLNHYVVNPISLDRVTGSTALSSFAGSITRDNPFSFFSDIDDRHTFNIDSKNAMEALTKDKHSILGLWGGDLVRHSYQVRLLKNGGSENESLFMYKKNLSSYEHKTSTKSLKTRITFTTTVKGEGEKAPDRTFTVTIDSPLINKYSQIYEDVIEVNDQDVKDEASLRKYGEQYYRTSLCDMMEDSLEIEVVGQSDVPVQMFDVVGVYHETFDLDVRKKITKYNYSPMAKKLKSIGFGQFQSGLASAIGNAVSDAVKNETHAFETRLNQEIKNADLAFDRKKEELTNQFTDEVNAIKSKAEENKRALSDEIDRRFQDFSPAGFEEAKSMAEEALRKAGAIPDLQDKFQIIDRMQSEQGTQLYRMSNEFQRVKETAQLYERIIGNTDNGIADNVARMALTNQLFQVEVAKNVGDSRNFVRNANFRDGSKNWTLKSSNGFNFNFDHSIKYRKKTGVHIFGQVANSDSSLEQKINLIVKSGGKITLSLLISKDGGPTFSGLRIGLQLRNNNSDISHLWKDVANSEIPWEKYKRLDFTFEVGSDIDEVILKLYGEQDKTINLYISEIKLETGSQATSFTLAPEDTEEAVKTVQTQLADSWAVKTLNGAGDIVSQINLNNNNALIEANKIRLKGKTLADEITAIDGYFKRLFVGDAKVGTLNADIIRTNSITADKLVMDLAMARRFVSSDIFTDTLAAKEAFINKLRSVVVSATLLEGYKGRIGGFQIGTHDKDPNSYWLTGQNQFKVGMGSGNGRWGQTALWVNWGNNWEKPGDAAWYVKNNGEMYCYNQAHFWNTPIIHGNLKVSGNIYYITDQNTGIGGYWIHSPSYKRIEEKAGYAYLYRFDDSYSWFTLNKDISDRRYKSNIQDSTVSGLNVIENLKTYSYRKEYDEKIEDIACGIMAQDVQKYAPEAFFENPDGAYSYNTFALVPYLIKAIQELNQKVERLEKTT